MIDFEAQRRRMVERYRAQGYIKSEEMARAMLAVPREEFMDPSYIQYAYYDQPFPIPGDGRQTISAPYMYPIFYEALEIRKGEKVLEIGAGSGYGAALARELVGPTGKVVSVEINKVTYEFARSNLQRTGYTDVILVLGDGSLGYEPEAPYDKICVTASCPEVPPPLIEQLKAPGRLIAPVGPPSSLWGQDLVLISKDEEGKIKRRTIMQVVYVPLQGRYGWVRR
ncbi:protein-L-isoaspartate(D-aspartate) O-methyltransferase [Candidatus Bathyarchaeota archaeon]|nr:MAG: protein-L-isoaspartate(D-aspartate) O-methyltransferase [Candidatus Bathyarchaeota archaeon]